MGDADRFQVVRPLGASGTTAVARDTSVEPPRPVVLETIAPSAPGGDLAPMLARARVLASLHHPKVVAVREVVEKDGGVLLVSDFVEGEWLAALMAIDPKPPLEVLLRIVLDVLEGLAALHDLKGGDGEVMSFVHGAVSPDSILVAEDGVAELARASIAPRAERGDRYVAPELRRGESPSDVKSDVYSVGAVLKEVLGAAPATAKWAERFTDIAWRACSVDPENRWPSAAAMATTLRRVAGNKLASADDVADYLRKNFGARMRARRAALDMLDEAPPPSSGDPISIRPQDMVVIDPQSAPTLVQAPVAPVPSVPPPVPKMALARVALVKKAVGPEAEERASEEPAPEEPEPETTRRPPSAVPAPAPSAPSAIAPMLPPPDIVPDVPREVPAVPAEASNESYRRRMPTFPTVNVEPPKRSIAAQAMGIAAAMVTTFGVGWWLGRNYPPGPETPQSACASMTATPAAARPPMPVALSTPLPVAPVVSSAPPSAVASTSVVPPAATPSSAASAPDTATPPATVARATTTRAQALVPPSPKPIAPAATPAVSAPPKPPEPPKPAKPPGADGYVPAEL